MLQADHCQTPINKNMIFYTTAHGNATPEYQNVSVDFSFHYAQRFAGARKHAQKSTPRLSECVFTAFLFTLPRTILTRGKATPQYQNVHVGWIF